MNDQFINHFDPTKPLETPDLREQYTKLTEEERLRVFCKLKGYTHVPPSIERLYSDSYYLGGPEFFDGGNSIFSFWKETLAKIFPSPVLTKYPFLVLSGAIGIGKSTASRICMANTIARLCCMENPWRTFGIARKKMSIVIFHRDADVAEVEFKKWLDDVYQFSPFFKNLPHPKHKPKIYVSGPLKNAGLGSDLIFSVLGEINFWTPPGGDDARPRERVASTLIRTTSRFDVDALQLCGGMILDSSCRGAGGPTETFLENADPKYTYFIDPPHWKVRPEMYARSEGQTFTVYKGDGKIPPQIVNKKELADGMDPDRCIECPKQLEGEAKSDIIKFLQDKAGVSTSSSDSFFGGSIEHIVNCSTIQNRIPEVITLDFFDKTDKILNKVAPMLQYLKYGTPVWVGMDIGVSKDYTGLSIVTFEGWKDLGDNSKLPKVRCWLLVGISRKNGQETSIYHLYDFVKDLSKRYDVIFSADQAFSRNLLQDLERDGVKTEYVSTDRSPDAAIYLKGLFQNELIEIPIHKRFQREAYDLRYTMTGSGKTKIDHPKKATLDPEVFDLNDGVGSKDIWDSLVSSCYSMKLWIDRGEEMGYGQGMMKQLQAMKQITADPREESAKNFQSMMEGIFNGY